MDKDEQLASKDALIGELKCALSNVLWSDPYRKNFEYLAEVLKRGESDARRELDRLKVMEKKYIRMCKRDDLFVAAMNEIQGALHGNSTKSVQEILDHCRSEMWKI